MSSNKEGTEGINPVSSDGWRFRSSDKIARTTTLISDGKVSGSHREVFPLVSYGQTAISAGNFSWNGYFNDEGVILYMP